MFGVVIRSLLLRYSSVLFMLLFYVTFKGFVRETVGKIFSQIFYLAQRIASIFVICTIIFINTELSGMQLTHFLTTKHDKVTSNK